MNYESTLRTLLEDAVPALRDSIEGTLIAGLVDGQQSVVFDLMRKAYDLGYRQALAAQPSSGASVGAIQEAASHVGAPDTAPDSEPDEDDFEPEATGPSGPELFRITADPVDAESGDDTEREGETAPPAEEERKSDVNWELLAETAATGSNSAAVRLSGTRSPPNLKIRTNTTVGSLRHRIVKVFELERFDIDVVVCRKGDRTRRQLKGSARLSKYLLVGPV
jgi:hypothetical protein